MLSMNLYRDDFCENIIFGFMELNLQHMILNFIVIYAKYFIFCCRQKENIEVDFYKFLPFFSFVLKKEIIHLKIVDLKSKELFVSELERIYGLLNP